MNKQLLSLLETAKNRLQEKIHTIDIFALQISDYNKRYLTDKLSSLDSVLSMYAKILYHSLQEMDMEKLNSFVFVDYGGGSGLLSLLAVQVGVGTVIYTDIYDVCCADAAIFSQSLNLPIKHFICGDIDKLGQLIKSNNIHIDAIASYDVVEHIYDVDLHFKELYALMGGNSNVIYASSANIANPLIVSVLKKKQQTAEYSSRKESWGDKKRDTLKAYFGARFDIIKNIAPGLDEFTIKSLSEKTRGLNVNDIYKFIEEYVKSGNLIYRNAHNTNTCDPYTGNWCEHLMEFKWLESVVKAPGFTCTIIPGSYYAKGRGYKNILKRAVNGIIKIFNSKALSLSPYYLICARKSISSMK